MPARHSSPSVEFPKTSKRGCSRHTIHTQHNIPVALSILTAMVAVIILVTAIVRVVITVTAIVTLIKSVAAIVTVIINVLAIVGTITNVTSTAILTQ